VDQPRYETSYPHNVANVVLALFPGLINTSAIAILAPVIGSDFGVGAATVGELPLLNDAALAFGCLLAAELARRVAGRTLFYWLMSLSLVASLASAAAPVFAVLLVAHIVHGLLGGMLFVVMLPPLLTTFGSAKIRATVTVLVPSLFGAATLGPVVGAAVSSSQAWRWIFVAEVAMSALALVLGRLTLAKREPAPTSDPPDYAALVLAGCGSAAIFIGVGGLARHDWTYPPALIPLAAGIAAFFALFVFEAITPRPLVPVRRLVTSIAVVGAIASIVGSACFAATQQCIIIGLERIVGLSPRATGFTLWPEFIVALVAGAVFGRLVATRWLVLTGTIGLVISAAAAAAAPLLPPAAASAPWLASFAALGAGFAVTPGIFVVALSFERAFVARAIALLNLLRLTGGFISGPGVEHTIGNRTATVLKSLEPAFRSGRGAARNYIVEGERIADVPLSAVRHALGDALTYALHISAVLALIAAAINAVILLIAHVPIRRPNLAAIDEGQPAVTASN
jgi:MFS family permease